MGTIIALVYWRDWLTGAVNEGIRELEYLDCLTGALNEAIKALM